MGKTGRLMSGGGRRRAFPSAGGGVDVVTAPEKRLGSVMRGAGGLGFSSGRKCELAESAQGHTL